ncbi:MAG: glycoside hydrolase family 3 C-terminal domain-containing protein [Candidatus Lokiarchaeota archaeon]|nr:glycoside hydrolase family 3 C-terminal domain-containing protein [Candidatus Lokiarchaeota archaeon]
MTESEIEEYVNYVLNHMSLEEKVNQMKGKRFIFKVIEDRGVGKRTYDAAGSKRFNIPPFEFTDGPRGVVIPGSTCFPVSMARGASWDLDLEERIGNVIGRETRAHGGNLFGGVCINLLRHPAWGRSQETYGEDPFLIGAFGAALTRGVQKHNVMATAKHYAANSIEKARFKVNVKMDERTLREVYLPHFKRCVEEGCATIMSAYNKFRGKYCGHNDYLLREILKGEWGFRGFVHSDWMDGVKDTVGGVTGGLDVEMPRAKYYKYKKIKNALDKGEITEDMIDGAARRVMRTILNFTTREDTQKYGQDLIGCEEHYKIALEAAEKSMVLIKNDNKIMPLDKNEIKKFAIFGKYASVKNVGDYGSSSVSVKEVSTPLKGIENYLGDSIEIVNCNGKDPVRVKKIAKEVDVSVVVVGLNWRDEGEYIKELKIGGDRDNLSLHDSDIELIKAVASENENCIVVLIGGSAITMEEWKEHVPAILMAWYSGVEGGNALAKILFGDVNPSGKLPFTIPKDPKNLPFFDKNADEIEYGYYHGYTLFDKEGYEPAFAFGYGLSYTSFSYNNLQAKVRDNNVMATVDVKNIGKVAGDEVVQLYIGFEESQIDRPVKLLKGFSRVHLEPHENKTIEIEVPVKNLAWYNPESKVWEIEHIKYTLYMGASSRKRDLLSVQFNI